MHNPVVKLHPNKDKALKVFNQQLKTLNKNEKIKKISNQSKNYKTLVMLTTLEIFPVNFKKCFKTTEFKTSFHGKLCGRKAQLVNLVVSCLTPHKQHHVVLV